jgi:hypothetical protein
MKASEKTYFDFYITHDRTSEKYGGIKISDKPTWNEKNLWDKIFEIVGENKFIHYIIEEERLVVAEETFPSTAAKLYEMEGLKVPQITEKEIRHDCYVTVYFDEK